MAQSKPNTLTAYNDPEYDAEQTLLALQARLRAELSPKLRAEYDALNRQMAAHYSSGLNPAEDVVLMRRFESLYIHPEFLAVMDELAAEWEDDAEYDLYVLPESDIARPPTQQGLKKAA